MKTPGSIHFLIALGLMGILCGKTLDAQTRTGPFLGADLAIAGNPDDLFGSAAIGADIGFRTPLGLVFLGEYLFAGTDFYYFDSADGEWSKPVSWSEVPSGNTSRGDWLFYRRRHVLGGSVGLGYHVQDLGFYSTIGFLLNILDLSPAAENYPAFEEAATRSSIGYSTVEASTVFRVGLVYPAQSIVAGRLSYLFLFQRDDIPGESGYITRNGLLMLSVVFQPGGLR